MSSPCRIVDARREDPFSFLAGRVAGDDPSLTATVAEIIERVRREGDEALLEYARKFDSPHVSKLTVTADELAAATVPDRHLEAIRLSVRRVRAFHEAQLEALTSGWIRDEGSWHWFRPEAHGGRVGQQMRPLKSVGIYVPGGKATYPSSVIMNSVPALCAGVSAVTIASPAGASGSLSPAVLVAARECGISRLVKVGGAAAVAAFAFGTESVPRVDKIAGPGNRYVNEAKRQLWGKVGLDLYAGPSEVCVLVDETSNAEFAAADLLTQVEHAEDNAGFLVSVSELKLSEVLAEVERQLSGAPREAVMREALRSCGAAFVARDLGEAIEIVNAIAPEHLTISTREPESAASRIENAGCILLGEYSPESAGDYVVGPSHTLPTSTAARFASPLNVLDFLKIQSVTSLNAPDLGGLLPAIEAFGEMEGFPAHARGASIRAQRN